MTLRMFLDAAFALQIREANRMGMPLLDALERFSPMAAVSPQVEEQRDEDIAVERDNARSMAELERMMMGVRRRG
jgi:hypothetical protein